MGDFDINRVSKEFLAEEFEKLLSKINEFEELGNYMSDYREVVREICDNESRMEFLDQLAFREAASEYIKTCVSLNEKYDFCILEENEDFENAIS